MLPAPISFVSRRGAFGGYEVIGWRYTKGVAWHIKSARKNRHRYGKAYVVRDGEFDPETALVNEKIAILTLIAQWEAGLPDGITDFLDFSKPD